MATRGDPGEEGDRPLRLLFVVPFSPRPDSHHGGRIVAQLLSRLATRHRIGIVFARWPGSRPIEAEIASRCELLEEIGLTDADVAAGRWRRRALAATGLVTGKPLTAAASGDLRLAAAAVAAAERWRPDVVQVDHDGIALCGSRLRESGAPAKLVLVCHEPGPLAAADQARARRGRRRLAHRIDGLSWRRYWARHLPAFDAIVALTDADRAVVDAAVSGPRTLTIGTAIDVPPEPLDPAGEDDGGVLFLGAYRHPPNADAALRLQRSIMPAVRARRPGARLTLVGPDPSPELRAEAGPLDRVTGLVPSVDPYVDAAEVLALPIRLGGGMRIKLLEALAAGKAVVASPLAAAGLLVGDGRELRLAESDEEFTATIAELLADEAQRRRLGAAARAWALENLTWDSRVEAYERLYRSLVAGPGAG